MAVLYFAKIKRCVIFKNSSFQIIFLNASSLHLADFQSSRRLRRLRADFEAGQPRSVPRAGRSERPGAARGASAAALGAEDAHLPPPRSCQRPPAPPSGRGPEPLASAAIRACRRAAQAHIRQCWPVRPPPPCRPALPHPRAPAGPPGRVAAPLRAAPAEGAG